MFAPTNISYGGRFQVFYSHSRTEQILVSLLCTSQSHFSSSEYTHQWCVCVCVCVWFVTPRTLVGGVSRLQILFARHRHIAAPGLGLISSRRTRSFLTRAAREVKPILISGAGWLVHWRSVGVRIDSDPTIGFGNRGIFVSSLMTRGCGGPRGCG